MPFAQTLSKFRDVIRQAAIDKKSSADILALCDELRDVDCVELGLKLEDTDAGALVKLMDKSELKREIQQKEEILQQQKEKKLNTKLEKEEKERQRLLKGKLPATEFFKERIQEFSVFDDHGIPTHDASGEPLSNSKLKKLKKEYENQAKLHLKYLESISK